MNIFQVFYRIKFNDNRIFNKQVKTVLPYFLPAIFYNNLELLFNFQASLVQGNYQCIFINRRQETGT